MTSGSSLDGIDTEEVGELVHQQLRELLRDAHGDSEFVVAVNIDIRGFSSFFSDSSQAAAFLSSAYTKILDDYFQDVSFFKPTGDGLLLVRVVSRQDLEAAVSAYVTSALRLDEDFSQICADDDLINFETPSRVGIGLARGTATRISNGDKVLDFSGYPLNLASRLMDLARPGGVVFDASLGFHLLAAEDADYFTESSVYVKGLADLSPMQVFVTADVVIPDANRSPIGAEYFSEKVESCLFREFKRRGPRFMHRLTHQPSSTESVRLHLSFPRTGPNGSKLENVLSTVEIEPLSVEQRPEGLLATFDYGHWSERLETAGVKSTWTIDATLSYSVPIGTAEQATSDGGESANATKGNESDGEAESTTTT